MAIVVDMFVIIRTLPEADIVDNELQVAAHSVSYRLQGFELTIDMLIDNDLLDSHRFILKGLPHGINPGRGGDLDLEARKTFPHEIDEVRDAHGDRIRAGLVDPFQKVNQLSITFSGVLQVSKTGGVQQVAEFQPSFVAGPYVSLHIFSIHLGQDKPGSRSPHNIEGKFPEEGIH